MPVAKPLELSCFTDGGKCVQVIVETPKGSPSKLKYNPKTGVFAVHRILPLGTTFPFDFGFVPSTLADDGDPLDVLLLMDQPTPVGCAVPARVLGVVRVMQRKKQRKLRNDRLIAVAGSSVRHADAPPAGRLDKSVLRDVERFFVSYHEAYGDEYECLGYQGAEAADKILRRAMRRFRARGEA